MKRKRDDASVWTSTHTYSSQTSDTSAKEREYGRRLSNASSSSEVQEIWQEASKNITLNEIHLTKALKGCQDDPKTAMRLLQDAKQAGVKLNVYHFTCVLRIPGTPTNKILMKMEKHSIEGNHFTWNAALTGCAAQDVWAIFDRISQPDRYAIASLLKKCTPKEVPKALKAAKRHGIQPDRAILNSAASSAPASFLKILKEIDVKPDLQFFNIVLNKAADMDLPDTARKAFAELKERGFRPDSFSLNRLLSALLRHGTQQGSMDGVEEARTVLEAHRKVIDKHTWTIFAKSLVESNRASEALQLYKQQQDNFVKLKPDVAFFNIYLSACAKTAQVDMAEQIRADLRRFTMADLVTHHCMIQVFAAAGRLDAAEEELQLMQVNGIEATARTYNSLIDAASKAADFKRARRLLQMMQDQNLEPDVFTFNILINSAANMGRCKKAESYFRTMQELGITPDIVTVVSLLNAYSHGAEAGKAMALHEQLPGLGLEPTTSSMNALIDCLSRSGDFEQAWEQIQAAEAGDLADTVTYMAFLGSCRNQKSKLHAKQVFEKLKQVADKPALASAYVLMSELYERLGQPAKARKLEAERLALGLTKQRGESYLHLPSGGATTFVAGPFEEEEMQLALDTFTTRLRQGGHQPDLASASARHDGDTAKEQSLRIHSEKKAVAVALTISSNGPINVTKNLRVCHALNCSSRPACALSPNAYLL